MATTPSPAANGDNGSRWRYGVNVVVAGLVFLFLCLLAALIMYWEQADPAKSSSAVATVLAPVAAVIGTIVGAYFGIQTGASTAERAEEARKEAERKVENLLAVTPEDKAREALGR